ncbi:YidC/Oxa1 family insertase periplasmic domain-containing protein, partial [Klebsiella pneumoniae]
PFALISRGGKPPVSGYAILHEGLIGYLGEQGLQEYTYKNIDDSKTPTGPDSRGVIFQNVTDAWLGITDKYWATALLPETNATLEKARFTNGD